LGFSEVGDDSVDDISGDDNGVPISEGVREEPSDSLLELEDRLLVGDGKISGAL